MQMVLELGSAAMHVSSTTSVRVSDAWTSKPSAAPARCSTRTAKWSRRARLAAPEDLKRRINQDFFMNAKAQAWWSLRTRFQRTYRWVVDKEPSPFGDIISLPRDLTNMGKLIGELSQPTFQISTVGKVVVDKKPEGAKSPNLADALMIRFAPASRAMKINPMVFQQLGMMRPMYAR